eukprot:CAMPEP_0201672050 /NCGR_PEP_ID=MMETSP0494-20130426/31341_1 /ASSEMBLY_ACC=CAM_ASM_000839 /TAXON_ID=420259 /ORGANISM="Thalassiosira gravida, Strain GMp14c1" /LENGTH=740 /DNA_ID=CAMNT_0048153581 /DNA_START=81 /DNA_END=2303 /DNA_ORIENTATION=-
MNNSHSEINDDTNGDAPIESVDGSSMAAATSVTASSVAGESNESTKSSTNNVPAAISPVNVMTVETTERCEKFPEIIPDVIAGQDAVAATVGQAEGQTNDLPSGNDAADPSTPTSQGLPKEEQTEAGTQPQKAKTATDDVTEDKTIDPSFQQDTMEFNVALESLETMRKLNLEIEFSSSSLSFPVDHAKCTYCQREALHKFMTDIPKSLDESANAAGERGITIGKVKLDGSRLRRFRSNVGGLFKKPPITPATKSCPPSLASPSNLTSMESMTSMDESIGGESNASIGTSASGNINSPKPKRRNILKKQPRPCLTCGQPTCAAHSSPTFLKRHITICQSCAYLFELDFLVDVITSTASDPKECQKKVDDLVDCYDRAKLLLVFTAKYSDEIASALETRTERSNKIGAGSSATGIVSGVAGVVGCGALLFPPVAAVGVPLLIASLVFGGGATAAQTGDAAAKFFSEPDRLAEKMVALHGMVLSLLRITEVLAYGLLKNVNVNLSVEGYSEDQKEEGAGDNEDDESKQREALAKEIQELLTKHGVNTTQAGVGGLQSAVLGSIVATEVVAAGALVGAESAAVVSTGAMVRSAGVVGRNTRYMGRVGTTAASGARFIPIAGGLLSAACIVVEGRELKKTLSRISEGNPCEKAEQVRSIRDEIGMLPDSSVIAAECHRVFELARQQEKLSKEAAESDERKQNQEKGENLTLEDVNAGDIADMISVMEASTVINGMKENTTTDTS